FEVETRLVSAVVEHKDGFIPPGSASVDLDPLLGCKRANTAGQSDCLHQSGRLANVEGAWPGHLTRDENLGFEVFVWSSDAGEGHRHIQVVLVVRLQLGLE